MLSIFKLKCSVPFAGLESINKVLDRLENLRVISPVDYCDWCVPTVEVKKKNSQIRVCEDYSTGLNDSLKTLNYPQPSLENIFAN